MRILSVLIVVAIAAAGFGTWSVCAKQATQRNSQSDAPAASDPVQKISLPQYPPELPAGPGKDAFLNNCLICHSARYVTMQPRFTRTVWQAEVQKMITAYGASISPTNKDAIVDYLVSSHGTKDTDAPQGQGAPAPK
jgi:sulfite dehydrogenase (cytochrome) subunit B